MAMASEEFSYEDFNIELTILLQALDDQHNTEIADEWNNICDNEYLHDHIYTVAQLFQYNFEFSILEGWCRILLAFWYNHRELVTMDNQMGLVFMAEEFDPTELHDCVHALYEYTNMMFVRDAGIEI